MANDGLVVGLDIGTTKVCAVIGERGENGILEITGVGLSPSTGMRKGVVVNIEATLKSVTAAIEAAEMMIGREVKSCWTAIGGSHIEGIDSRGVVAVAGKNRATREISADDIARVLEVAREVVIPMDRQILEVIPKGFKVDGHDGIKDPLDMIGVRLEAEVYIITCSVTSAQNLIKCVNRAGFRVNNLVLQILAAGRSVLTEEEKNLGVVLIDLGGGTTEMLVYSEGAPFLTTSIPAGGTHITNDISLINHISYETAEKIKIEAGCCWEGLLEDDDTVLVPGVGGRPPLPIPRSKIMGIIKPRMAEIFRMLNEKLDSLSLSHPLVGGIVLTGGGAQLPGAAELASSIFDKQVRVGSPLPDKTVRGGIPEECRSPVYAAAVGLVLEVNDREKAAGLDRNVEIRKAEKGQTAIFGKLRDWLEKDFF